MINKRNTHISEKENVRIKPRERQKLNWDDKLTLEFNGDAPQLSELIIEKVNNVPTVDVYKRQVIGDRGYISAQVQLDLFETANIRLEVPYRTNQKKWKPTFPAFAKARKRIETLFSQLCDHFMIIRNYAKDTDGDVYKRQPMELKKPSCYIFFL